MRVELILPALTEATSPPWRPWHRGRTRYPRFEGGRPFYMQAADAALAGIERLPADTWTS